MKESELIPQLDFGFISYRFVLLIGQVLPSQEDG